MTDPIARTCRFSPWLQRHIAGGLIDPAVLRPMLERTLTPQDFAAFAPWDGMAAQHDEAGLARSLRLLRRYVLAQIMVRDLCRLSDLAGVTGTMTAFADFAVNTALPFAHAQCAARYGEPIGRHSGEIQHLSVVAMGKAGGFELNVSSDLDLVFVFPENGETDGRRSIGNQEFFTKTGRKLIALLNDATADGQVFRIDMRLRPDGDSGALVSSEAALEQYLLTQGREWERYAWCKGRVVTPYPNGIADLVRPFVFRRYLDYSAYDAMRALHSQIRAEVGRKGLRDNIKLGAGGIREVEFVAQIFQMIRGGRDRLLQLKGTQETLAALASAGVLPQEDADTLLDAYRFLRDTEHRLQYWDDRQTQTLPEAPEQQALLAESMGFDGYAAFSGCLENHRAAVSSIFNGILDTPEPHGSHPLAALWAQIGSGTEEDGGTADALSSLGFQAASAARRLAELKNGSRYRRLSAAAQPRFDSLLPQVLQAAAAAPQPDAALHRLTGLLEAVARRPAYLAFLQQHPPVLQRLAVLLGQSGWLADYLTRHPALLDETVSPPAAPDWPQLDNSLAAALDACDGAESKMDALRHFQHAQIFRLAVQDLDGRYTVEALSDELSRLADTVLRHTLAHCWRETPRTHRSDPQFALIAYGKLGGKELGYTSDLDLVYLYDDPHPDAAECYGRLARRLGTWLSGSTGAGTLYDIDLRLRPNGDAGFLVHSLAAFEKYQRENAWVWEHQALSRARFVCGSSAIGESFERIRRSILSAPRDPAALAADITAMREKMFPAHPPADTDAKYARGGIVDVEFAVQYLILTHSRHHPALLENHGNIALLQQAARSGLIPPAQAEAARSAYRRYRQIQHRAKLLDTPAAAPDPEDLAAVRRLWQTVFGQTPKAA